LVESDKTTIFTPLILKPQNKTMKNYDNLLSAVVDSEDLETSMMKETFFNNDDSVVRMMKVKFSKAILKFPHEKRKELKIVGEEITEAYKMTKSFSIINGTTEYTSPKQYIYAMMKQGKWDGWMLLAVSPYLSNELEEAVLKYFVSPKNAESF
jgi:hypothetical protein